MAATLAIVLPPPGTDPGPAEHLLAALATHPGRFDPVVLAPPGRAAVAGLPMLTVTPAWWRGYPAAVAATLAALRPAVIEVHDAPALAARLGSLFRPIPVVLVVHADPRTLPGAADAAARTLLLALATRVAAATPAIRARMLDGVHPAMRNCAVLPPAGDPAAAAAALDALRQDALQAWSRPLRGPI